MNYLAHIYLSGPDPQHQVGGLLGDFVKGPLHRQALPPAIVDGIQLHRQIDTATDHHPAFRALLRRLPSPWRRFGGILLDMYFDHLLASHWSRFHHHSLQVFCRQFYQHLNHHFPLLPPQAQRFARRAPQVHWLENYANRAMMPDMLNHLGNRLKRPLPLGEAWPELERHDPIINQVFDQLMRHHQTLAKDFLHQP